MAGAYGVWKEKSMYGRKYMGIERSTFLIDEEGKVAGGVAEGEADRATPSSWRGRSRGRALRPTG